MIGNPYLHASAYWRPIINGCGWEHISSYRHPGEREPRSINVWASDTDPRPYRVVHGDAEFSLFAAVHPIDDPPDSAEVLAEIRDMSGKHHSFVLWFEGEQSAVIPFDPNAAIEAFWFERFVPAANRTVLPPAILSAYYSVKPLVPSGIRRQLRKVITARALKAETLLSWPSDRSLDRLMQLLLVLILKTTRRDSLSFLWFWPDRHPWAAILTHDVETAAGLAHVPDIVEIEMERGLRSSFNLVPYDYEVGGPLLSDLHDAGFEVGVHGYTHDGLMFSEWSTFLKRAVAVNEVGRQWGAVGFRSPATYRNLEWFHLLGFEYDSSVTDTAPFEPQPGGCASVFPYVVGDLVELPMTLPQDHTLFGLLGQADSDVWLSKLAEIRDANGMACVLTHPDSGNGYIGVPENEAHYIEVLDFIGDSEAWTPLPRELARWWHARANALTGFDGLQRASVATARLDSADCLVILAPKS